MPISTSVITQLRRIVGQENVLSEDADLFLYAYDASFPEHRPDAVVFPRTTEAVSQVMALACEERTPVVPRGAGTGLSGGSVPMQGGITLCFSKMNRLTAVDPDNLTATVESTTGEPYLFCLANDILTTVQLVVKPTGVSIDDLVLGVDEAFTLAPTLAPTGAVTSLTYRISNTAVATVDALGVVRAKKVGAAEEAGDLEDAAGMLQEALVSLGDDGVGRWDEIPPDVGVPLTALRDALWKTQTALATGQEGDATERQTVRAALENMHDAAVRMLALDEADVVWMTDRRALCVAPLTVSDLLRERLFGENTVVLTSATLALGGRFDAMAATWGLPKGQWDGMDVGTPFDPAKSGILYVARHLPKPGRDGTDPKVMDEMAELIKAAGGRTLGLFSSRRGAEAAAEEMRKRLPFDVMCQGDDAIGNLVEKFAASENSCLFGTLTLWQGVDVPGPALSLVVIDRIPFPRPDDPLLSARSDAANEAGRSGFMEVSATHAALLMAQGAGRLLRSVDDRGVVAVLDPRLATQRYGSWIAASMPPFWRTTDGATARKALERLVAQRFGG